MVKLKKERAREREGAVSGLPIRRWPDPDPVAALRAPWRTRRRLQGSLPTCSRRCMPRPARGLAAPQIGHAIRLFVMDVAWKDGAPDPFICVNPSIIAHAAETVAGPEACLSIPGVTAEVPRSPWIVLRWTTPEGVLHEQRLDGAAAICAQHEQDHLDGIVTFDRVSSEARRALEADYAG